MSLHDMARAIGRTAGRLHAGVANLARSVYGEWDSSLQGSLAGFRAGGPFGQQFYSRRNVTQWMMAYGQNSRLRSPVHRLALDVASVDWHLYRRDPSDPTKRTEIFDHPLLKLINSRHGMPNPWLSWRKTTMLNQIYNELAGEWFLWMRRPPPARNPITGELSWQPPLEVWPIPPHWVASIPTWRQSKQGAVFFDPMYRFSFAGGEVLEMLMSEIIWHYEPNPLNPYWRGLGAAAAVDDEVSQLEWMAKYNNAFFRNSAVPGVLVSVDKVTTPAQVEQLEEWWKTKHSGFARAFEPAFLNAGTTVTSLSKDHSELEFDASSLRLRDTVNQNWQEPPEIMGIAASSNRQAFDSSLYQQNHQNVRPRLMDLSDDFNAYLVPLYGDPYLEMDFDNPVKESAEFILRRTNEGLTRGALEVDEWRIPNGYEPLGPDRGGDERYIPVNVNVVLPDGSMTIGPNQSQQGQPTGSPADVVGPTPPRPPSKAAPAPPSLNGKLHSEEDGPRFILVP